MIIKPMGEMGLGDGEVRTWDIHTSYNDWREQMPWECSTDV